MGARETALNALIACRKSGAWPNGALKEYIARDRLSPRDAALATRLCYGVLQNRNKLDFYLKQLLTGRLKDLHPVVRDILHLGLYQIYELDKVPESAAVNESVTLAKKYCKNPKAGALVNAVLRKAAATKGTLQEPVSYADRYSHPDELISLLKANLPKGKLEPMLIADNAAPRTVVQVNTLRISAEELAERLTAEHVCVRPHEWMADCLVLSGTGSLEQMPAFREGLFYVQDPAAKLSVLCAGLPESGGNVLDCCAAPGGKSFAAAIAMGGKGSIVSCDIYPHKTALIENGAARLGLTNITARQQDASQTVPGVGRCYGHRHCRRALFRPWHHPEKTGYPIQKPERAGRPSGLAVENSGDSGVLCQTRRHAAVFHLHRAETGKRGCGFRIPCSARRVYHRAAAAAGCIPQKRNRDAHPDPWRV